MNMSEGYKVLSLFSGAGGFDLGFKEAGYDIVWANEIDRDTSCTYINNIGNHLVEGDIRDIPDSKLPKDIDVVIGGFPCQGFSMAGKRKVDDERNFLYKEMKRVVHSVKPKVFVAENVRGLLSMNKGLVMEKILNDFREIGYKVSYKLLYAPDFNVPQNRFRVFIVGTLNNKSIMYPTPIVNKYLTTKDSIGDIVELGGLPNHEINQSWPDYYDDIMDRINEGQKLCNSRHGKSSVYTWDIPDVFGETTEFERSLLETVARNRRRREFGPKDGNPLSSDDITKLMNTDKTLVKDTIHRLVEKEYLIEREEGKFDITKASFNRFRRLSWDEPSPTILTNFDSPRNYVHPSVNRPLTVRETARLQTFPDNFVFHGSYKNQYKQVGNAVPPKLAYYVALSIKNILDEEEL